MSDDIKVTSAFKSFLDNAPKNAYTQGMEAFKGAYFMLLSMPPGAERAWVLHRISEQQLAMDAYKQVTCRVGCTACCETRPHITGDEAKLLADVVKERGITIDMDRLREAAADTSTVEEWRKKRIPCVFLNDQGRCEVYHDRPLTCRNHHVRSDPALCAKCDAVISLLNNPMAEALSSAAATIAGDGTLPQMLLKELG
jgi:Fe-S-cluster containining protein